MSQTAQNRMGPDQSNTKVVDLKQTRMDGPTFRALRDYFDEWGEKDQTLLKGVQRDVSREMESND